MDKNIDRHLVIRALLMTVWKRQTKTKVLVHSDQGRQYSITDYVAFLQANNLEPSMSRRGNCHDNAVAESFFAKFKKRVIQPEMMQERRYLILSRCSTIR
jgi:putative transposase